jgi:choline kinase
MIVIILAAGQGSRLHPLTKHIPKCLVKYKGKSIISHQLEVYKKFKINQIYLVSGYKSSKINFLKIKKKKNSEFKNTNMVYSLFKLSSLFDGKNDIIICYGDIIFKEKTFKKIYQDKNSLSTLIDKNWLYYWKKRFKNPLNDAETLKYDNKKFITEIGNKAKNYNQISGQFVGLIKFKKEITKNILAEWKNLQSIRNKKKIRNLFFTDFLTILIKKKYKLKAILIKRGWLEFDNKKDLKINF